MSRAWRKFHIHTTLLATTESVMLLIILCHTFPLSFIRRRDIIQPCTTSHGMRRSGFTLVFRGKVTRWLPSR